MTPNKWTTHNESIWAAHGEGDYFDVRFQFQLHIGVLVLSGRASFGYSTLASEEKASEKW
jgi:hypothetical protein